MNTIIIIPVRMAAIRLPNKPLALIHNKPMILWVAEQAKKSKAGKVIIACDGKEIASIARDNGYEAIITDPSLNSGTDRVFAAIHDSFSHFDCIVNLQGDMPFIDPQIIQNTCKFFQENNQYDITTAVAKIESREEFMNPNVVKALFSPESGKCLYFTRSPCPFDDMSNSYKHIGIYAYKPQALKRFVSLASSPLEKSERLEQLRAMENGMSIGATLVDSYPISVDTIEDLEKARNYKIER